MHSHAATAELQQFTTLSRILHWLTAILVFSTLLIGFTMVSSVSDYATLLKIHKTLGVVILAVVIIRVVNRLTHRPPQPPPTVSPTPHLHARRPPKSAEAVRPTG